MAVVEATLLCHMNPSRRVLISGSFEESPPSRYAPAGRQEFPPCIFVQVRGTWAAAPVLGWRPWVVLRYTIH